MNPQSLITKEDSNGLTFYGGAVKTRAAMKITDRRIAPQTISNTT